MNQCEASRAYAQALTAWRNAIRDGTDSPDPQPPALAGVAVPPEVPPGIVPRFITLVQSLKKHKNYTTSMGENLRIEGEEETSAPVAAKPALKVRLAGGQPEVVWEKGEFTSLEIEVDRGAGFVFLANDTVPNYIDTFTPPATPAVWKYRAFYHLRDVRVGAWSDIVSITVG